MRLTLSTRHDGTDLEGMADRGLAPFYAAKGVYKKKIVCCLVHQIFRSAMEGGGREEENTKTNHHKNMRTRHSPKNEGPVPLSRMSALVPIRFTTKGCELARKLCMEYNCDNYWIDKQVTLDGSVIFRVCNQAGRMWAFTKFEDVPEFVVRDP